MPPTGYIRLENGSFLRRQLGPQRFALDTKGCRRADLGTCCFFRDSTPDALAWTISGATDNGSECSCNDGTIYLGWDSCGDGYTCNWWNEFSCTDGSLPGCLPAFSPNYNEHGIGAQLVCTGGQPFITVHAGKGDDALLLYRKNLDSGNWPICGDFSFTLDKVDAPSWMPATCTLSSSNGSTPTDLDDLYHILGGQFWPYCQDCGAVANQYEVTLAGFIYCVDIDDSTCPCLNDTFTLTKVEPSGCGEAYWFCNIGNCINGQNTCIFMTIGAKIEVWVEYGNALCGPGAGTLSFGFDANTPADCLVSGMSLAFSWACNPALCNNAGASAVRGSVTVSAVS